MTPLEASILNLVRKTGPRTIAGLHAAMPESPITILERLVLRMYMTGHLSREVHPAPGHGGQIVYGQMGDCEWTAEHEIRLALAVTQEPKSS